MQSRGAQDFYEETFVERCWSKMWLSLGNWIDLGLNFDWYQIQIDFKLTFSIQICLQNVHCCFEIDYIVTRLTEKFERDQK